MNYIAAPGLLSVKCSSCTSLIRFKHKQNNNNNNNNNNNKLKITNSMAY